MAQKQRKAGTPDEAAESKSKTGTVEVPDSSKAIGKIDRVLKEKSPSEQKQKKKKGHWSYCCGVRTWVEDE